MSKQKFLRTCVVCKKAQNKEELFRFIVWNGKVVLDYYNKINSRGFYTCSTNECIKKLNINHVKKTLKKNIEYVLDLEEILHTLEKNLQKDILSLLRILNKAGLLKATTNKFMQEVKINMTFDYVFVANDIAENSREKIKHYIKNLEQFDFFNKKELGEIFNKNEVSVVGVVKSELSEKLFRRIKKYTNIYAMGGL